MDQFHPSEVSLGHVIELFCPVLFREAKISIFIIMSIVGEGD